MRTIRGARRWMRWSGSTRRSVLVAVTVLAGVDATARASDVDSLPIESLRPDFEYGGHGVLDHPSVVARTPAGHVLILDSGHHRIVRLDASGEFVDTIGRKGARPGRFDAPTGLDVAADGTILVADRGNERIQTLDPEGRSLSEWDSTGGINDVLAIGGGHYLLSRSFELGTAAFYELDSEHQILRGVGDRMSGGTNVGLEASLNHFVASTIGGHVWLAYRSLAKIVVLDSEGRSVTELHPRTPEMRREHEKYHASNLARVGRPETCEPMTHDALVDDMVALCEDGGRHYVTYVAGVGGFAKRRFFLSLGVLNEFDARGRVTRRFAFEDSIGQTVPIHRMTITEDGLCYAIDRFHEFVVRRYDLSATASEASDGEAVPDR